MLVQVCGHWLESYGNFALNQDQAEKWIKSQRDDGFSITAMAGDAWGASLVVMSKGTPYTHQVYKVNLQPSMFIAQRGCVIHPFISYRLFNP